MGRLTQDERKSFAESILQWGNGVFLGLVIAQSISPRPFDYIVATLGFVLLASAYWIAYLLMRKRG